MLPVMELPEPEHSPYSALTSFALDPTYIALPEVPDFEALGGERALDDADREALAGLRRAGRVRYAEVRALKRRWLRRAWEHFAHVELPGRTGRADAFGDFCERESWWLHDYTLFRALLDRHDQRAWWEWPEASAAGRLRGLVVARNGSARRGDVPDVSAVDCR